MGLAQQAFAKILESDPFIVFLISLTFKKLFRKDNYPVILQIPLVLWIQDSDKSNYAASIRRCKKSRRSFRPPHFTGGNFITILGLNDKTSPFPSKLKDNIFINFVNQKTQENHCNFCIRTPSYLKRNISLQIQRNP
ncbi:MAG: hypothetical protein AMJ73_03545 [candidate division Zixibacteria bacterium SM1_73]|nr:MAG: hypothetical protein AMJ73_03545 [candidate division Zixibacteria bacterium SM1_73]